jgi:GNAT superfamily N-acetyltransferase
LDVSVRLARPEDIEALVKLRELLLREDGEIAEDTVADAVADANRRYFSQKLQSGEFLAWVAEAKGQVVACSGMVLFARPPYPGNLLGLEAYVLNMYTRPEWRRRGIASLLLQRLIQSAKEAGASRIWLHATPAGRPVYERAGFTPKLSEMELLL